MTTPFNRPQWEAARMLVARLGAEANGTELAFSQIGMTWMDIPDQVCAVTDDGVDILTGELVYAAMVMLWSIILDRAEEEGVEPSMILADLGLNLAKVEPSH